MINKIVDESDLVVTIPIKPKRPESVKRAQKKYYLKNKAKLVSEQLAYNRVYVRETYKCECSDVLQKSGKYLHNKSNRHKTRMNNIADGKSPDYDASRKKINCVCGSSFLKKNTSQHEKSKKHIKYLEETDKIEGDK
tara:strand:+ start:528 stop:938 length:411 start_codon:yes stop_codon:yes gene_type:complete